MARGIKPQAVEPAAATDKEDDKEEKLNLGDSGGLKRKLDEAVIEVVADAGYPEDHAVGNVKLLLGFLTVAVALAAQFWPGKFPDTWPVLFMCVVAYFILSSTLTWYGGKYEGDSILNTRPCRRSSGGAGRGCCLRVSSRLPRFSDLYTLEIADGQPQAMPLASMERSVARYFYSDGGFAAPQFKADVEALLDQALAKKG